MKPSVRGVRDFATSPWFIVISGLSSIGAFLWFVHDKITATPSIASSIGLAIAVLVLLAGYAYSVKVRSENVALRGIGESLFEINHLYRHELQGMFRSGNPTTNPADLLSSEERVLRSVCQRIENIYARVINRNCMVTIKLITTESEGRHYAHTYVRSQEMCIRDQPDRMRFAVGSGENTAFDRALEKRGDGLPSHFFSPDLEEERGYSNQRQHYIRFYKSALVVPIRGENKGKEGTSEEFDLIGFLCVDTLSTHRFNAGYQLFLLSGFANQMYNFMSLMRGKYTVLVG